MVDRLGKDTLSVHEPTWSVDVFTDAEAQALWLELPLLLRGIAVAEFENGNSAQSILRSNERNIVLLAFKHPPTTAPPDPARVRVHTTHAVGNYCYDDTRCTYEDLATGCFLAFHDPALAQVDDF